MALFDSTRESMLEILKSVKNGKIQLPDFQRGWVWDDEHILSLLVSIARSFPIGAIMLLENGGEAKFKNRMIEGFESENSTTIPDKLILDGQQRLTSLAQVLMMDKPVKTFDSKKKKIERYYYIDINRALSDWSNIDGAFFSVDADKKIKPSFSNRESVDLSSTELEYEKFCFPCAQIFDSDDWEHGLYQYENKKMNDYMLFRRQVLNSFRQYNIPVIHLSKENRKEAICLVFEKVNTGGVTLSVFELITATYAIEGANLREEWFQKTTDGKPGLKLRLEMTNNLKDIKATDFFQSLTLKYTKEKRNRDIQEGKTGKSISGVSAKKDAVLSTPYSFYNANRDDMVDGFKRVSKFLKQELFLSAKNIPYSTQLVPLASVLSEIKDQWLEPVIYDKIKRWFWCGVLGELYGGASETRIALDYIQLLDWIKGKDELPETIVNATFQEERLFSLRSKVSAAYKGLSALILQGNAQDFFWKTSIKSLNESDWDEYRLDIHHIFPKAWCEKNHIKPSIYNSIINKTPISYKANRTIGDKAPSDYIVLIRDHEKVNLTEQNFDEILLSHYIDSDSLKSNDFNGFISKRKDELIKIIEKATGKEVVRSNELIIAEESADEESDE